LVKYHCDKRGVGCVHKCIMLHETLDLINEGQLKNLYFILDSKPNLSPAFYSSIGKLLSPVFNTYIQREYRYCPRKQLEICKLKRGFWRLVDVECLLDNY